MASPPSSSEEDLLQFLYACPVGLVECRFDGEIVMINPHAVLHLLPIAGDGDLENLFVVLERQAPEIRTLVDAFAPATGKICDCHRIIVDVPGGRRDSPTVLSCTLVKLGKDRIMATLSDVSAQFAQERRLKLADAWFSTLLDRVNDYTVLTVSPEGVIAAADGSFTRQTGYACEDVIGQPLAGILTQDAVDRTVSLTEQLRIAAREGWFLEECWQDRRDEGRYWCQRLIVARIDHQTAQLAGFSIVLRNVPYRDAATAELRRLLNYDHLTGAANRAQFRRVLERETVRWRETERPLSLLLLDLDHFKKVNDEHGHPAGDAVLRKVAETCTGLLRPRDLLGRLGGEEFGVLLPGTTLDGAREMAETIRLAVAGLVIDGPHAPLRVTASLGCATLTEASGSIDELVALADNRLYAAKRDGRNRVVCHSPALP